MKINKALSMYGKPPLPADKSISHRAAILASIVDGPTTIRNFSASADCASTLNALTQLGVAIERDDRHVLVHGCGTSGFQRYEGSIDCGNSGTTMRLLSGILAGQDLESTLTGDSSLLSRPMERIAGPLSMMGASVKTTNGKAPLHIRGHTPLKAIEYRLPIASAQIKSALLMAGLFAAGTTTIIEPVRTRDHTERMLEWLGIEIEREQKMDGLWISISGHRNLKPSTINVPADISAAAFFIVAAACLQGSDIWLENVGVNPTRTGILDVLREIGVDVTLDSKRMVCNEPVATIRVLGGIDPTPGEKPATVRSEMIANLIDELPILAVLGTQLPNGLEIRGAAELRHKESDRISSICTNLALMGAGVTEFADGFFVPHTDLRGAVIDSFGDHRIAMAFAVAGLLADGETVIEGAECADISFPGFFGTLQSIVT